MKIKKSFKTEETTTWQIELDQNHLLDYLIHYCHQTKGINLLDKKTHVEFCFNVPGGGDWANANIPIDNQNPIHVKIISTNVEEIHYA